MHLIVFEKIGSKVDQVWACFSVNADRWNYCSRANSFFDFSKNLKNC